jgi:hypothetical protein
MDQPQASPSEAVVIDPAVIWTAESLATDWKHVAQSLAGSRKAIEHSRELLARCHPWGPEHGCDC